MTPATYSYDATTRVGTWTFGAPMSPDQYLISLSDLVVDTAGNQLDGEWTNPFRTTTGSGVGVSTFPSGNGTAGGDFNFVITMMPGDANASNVIEFFDHFIWQVNSGGSNKTFSQGDFDGNGLVDGNDELFISGYSNLNLTRLKTADFNHDGLVDGADFLIWQVNVGSGTDQAHGDADNDFDVDGDDMAVWARQNGLYLAWVA